MWAIRKILKRNNVRGINIHYPGLNSITFLLMKRIGLFRGRLVVSFHGSDLRWGMSLAGASGFLWRTLVRSSDKITVVSQKLADSLISRWPDLRDRVCVIYNGVDAALFGSIRLHPPLRGSAVVVISVASFDYVKGTDVLLRAIPVLLHRYPTMRLMLVGESGGEDDSLRSLSRDLGIEASIDWHFDVPHEDIPALLSQADVFVLPSRDEGLGMALLEAGASGLPSIASRVGGIPEVLDGSDGILVPAEDPAAIAEALFWMLANRDSAIDMGRRFRRSVIEKFSWEATCRQYTDLVLT